MSEADKQQPLPKQYPQLTGADFDQLLKGFQKMIFDAIAQTTVPRATKDEVLGSVEEAGVYASPAPVATKDDWIAPVPEAPGPFGGEAAKTTAGMSIPAVTSDMIVGGVATVNKNRIALMSVPQIAIINQSTVLSDADLRNAIMPFQHQITDHLAAYWGKSAYLVFYSANDIAKIPSHAWQVVATDNSDMAGALGYHDITKGGQPLGKAFVKTDIDLNRSWSITLTHEILEIIVDPWVNLQIAVSFTDPPPANTPHTKIYAYESCDACESDPYGYMIGNVLVTDFVTPAWFMPTPTVFGPDVRFDYQQKIPGPLQLLPGGYIGVQVDCGAWTQEMPPAQQKHFNYLDAIGRPGSRRERRGRPHWMRSEI